MAWTTPRTWVNAELVTAALLNAHVRDDLQYLKDVLDGTASQNVKFTGNFLANANAYAIAIVASATVGQSLGLKVQGGTNGSDYALVVQNQAGSQGFLYVLGNGNVQIGAGSLAIATGLTVTAGGASITGNSTITGTLGGLTGLTVASGGASIAGNLTLPDAASQIVPGATSFAVRNNANNASNILVTDAGALTVRSGLTVSAGGASITGDSSIAGVLSIGALSPGTSSAGKFFASGAASVGAGGFTTIHAIPGASVMLVWGDAGGSNFFADVVAAIANGTFVVLGTAIQNSPPTRTYTVSGTSLQLKLSSGTASVYVTGCGS